MLRRLLPLLVALSPAMAAAEDAAPVMTQAALDEAEAIFFEGLAHYRAGRFEPAAVAFQKAYTLTKQRDLLYNVARSREMLADKEGAVQWYRAYLATQPADETAIIHRIKQLGGDPTLPSEGPKDTLMPVTRQALPPETVDAMDPWPWVAVGTAVVAAGVGTWLGLTALDDASAARESKKRAEAEELKSSAESGALLADLSFGVSALALGAAVYLWWRDDAASPAGSVQVGAGKDAVHLGWQLRF
ncbi:MAG: hypothetical protein H6706_25145 [Myxococcales bacterium]|nr:hypothetical protein [Myxococcales bacterium]